MQEIMFPQQVYIGTIFIFTILPIGGLLLCIGVDKEKKSISIIGTILVIMAIVISMTYITTGMQEYREQIREQVESLGCEDLQEAHELYEKEFIKDKYIFECIETRGVMGWVLKQ